MTKEESIATLANLFLATGTKADLVMCLEVAYNMGQCAGVEESTKAIEASNKRRKAPSIKP